MNLLEKQLSTVYFNQEALQWLHVPLPSSVQKLFGIVVWFNDASSISEDLTDVASDIVGRLHKKYSEIFRTQMFTTDSHETIP